jgi:hypothetical protein
MKLLSLLFVSSTLAVSAFGVTPNPSVTKAGVLRPTTSIAGPAFRTKDASVNSPLFRDPALMVRGGAVPGWEAYNRALDDHPLTAKAFTSLVGWALGDLLAQVRRTNESVEAIGFFFVLFWYAMDPSTHTFKLQRKNLKNYVNCNHLFMLDSTYFVSYRFFLCVYIILF